MAHKVRVMGEEEAAGQALQVTMFGERPNVKEHAKTVEEAVAGMASAVIDSGGDGKFAAKMTVARESVTQAGVIMVETWSIQVSAQPKKGRGR